MNELSEIVEQLKNIRLLDDMIVDSYSNKKVYETAKGKAHSLGLYKDKDIAIAITNVQAGDEFFEHQHKEKEWIIIIEGEGIIFINGIASFYSERDSYIIQPNIKHKLKTDTYTRFLVITMPSNIAFPRGVIK